MIYRAFDRNDFEIKEYDESDRDEWDELVECDSANGTFLNTRRFADYHPKNRFDEKSYVFRDKKGNVAAVCLGNILSCDDKKVYYSYQGATFGGPIISRKYYKAKYVIPIIRQLTDALYDEVDEIIIRPTPKLFSEEDSELLEYSLYYNGYEERRELTSVISFENYKVDIISNLSQGKRTHVHKCENRGIEVREIFSDDEVIEYYGILCENLLKYDTTPVHSIKELLDFKNNRLKKECGFFGAYLDGRMVAGGMLFYFHNTKVVHAQYLSEKNEVLKLSPMTYLYYWIITEMKRRGFRSISWGNTTEDYGRMINEGLINSKEDFGSGYGSNLSFHIRKIKNG